MYLVARLKNLRSILVKALETIGEHLEILLILATLDSSLEGLQVGDMVDAPVASSPLPKGSTAR